jgi:hypothetical protein
MAKRKRKELVKKGAGVYTQVTDERLTQGIGTLPF